MAQYLIWIGTLPRSLGLLVLTTPVLIFNVATILIFNAVYPIPHIENHIVAGIFYSVTITPFCGNITLNLLNRVVKTREKLRRQADTDPLTGLLNRRAFFRAVECRNGQFEDMTGQHSVIFFDLDHFKAINDRYGHQLGDAVIQHFTRALQAHVGEGDLIARFGGEEFIAHLSGATLQEATEIAEQIRLMVDGSAVTFNEQSIHYTVSAGAVNGSMDDDIDHLIRNADQLLYQAKSEGRNRVCTGLHSAILGDAPQPLPLRLQLLVTA